MELEREITSVFCIFDEKTISILNSIEIDKDTPWVIVNLKNELVDSIIKSDVGEPKYISNRIVTHFDAHLEIFKNYKLSHKVVISENYFNEIGD